MSRLIGALVGASVVTAAVAASSSAQQPVRTITFQEVERGATFRFVDNPPRSPRRRGFPVRVSPGDAFVIASPLRAGGARFGTLRATCFISRRSVADRARGDCIGIFALPDGQVFVTAPLTPSNTTSGTVIGGTGAYANARGTFVSRSTRRGSDDVITLTQ